MPDIDRAGYGVNPSAEPLSYPGRVVHQNMLIVNLAWLYQIGPGRALSDWPVSVDDGPLHPMDAAEPPLLDQVLSHGGWPLMGQRQPFLAVGSNASPGQLRHKFAGAGVYDALPILRARVAGLGVAHSAHVSLAGYIPYAPYRNDQAECSLVVLWLSEQQKAVMDATEPNYEALELSPPATSVTLDSGQSIERTSAYRSRWGVITSQPSGPVQAAGTQADILERLVSQEWFEPIWQGTAAETMSALANSPEMRQLLRDMLARHQMASGDGF